MSHIRVATPINEFKLRLTSYSARTTEYRILPLRTLTSSVSFLFSALEHLQVSVWLIFCLELEAFLKNARINTTAVLWLSHKSIALVFTLLTNVSVSLIIIHTFIGPFDAAFCRILIFLNVVFPIWITWVGASIAVLIIASSIWRGLKLLFNKEIRSVLLVLSHCNLKGQNLTCSGSYIRKFHQYTIKHFSWELRWGSARNWLKNFEPGMLMMKYLNDVRCCFPLRNLAIFLVIPSTVNVMVTVW